MSYRFMRVLVFFDLPVQTSEDIVIVVSVLQVCLKGIVLAEEEEEQWNT